MVLFLHPLALYACVFGVHCPVCECATSTFITCHHSFCAPHTTTPPSQEETKLPPPLPKKPAGGVTGSLRAESMVETGVGGTGGTLMVSRGRSMPMPLPLREKSLELGDRQRLEARRRLLQAGPKRAASFRQNSATESGDSIEIYIPEAQTRL